MTTMNHVIAIVLGGATAWLLYQAVLAVIKTLSGEGE